MKKSREILSVRNVFLRPASERGSLRRFAIKFRVRDIAWDLNVFVICTKIVVGRMRYGV